MPIGTKSQNRLIGQVKLFIFFPDQKLMIKTLLIFLEFFFTFTEGKSAYNTFACSRDLKNWTIWKGKPLIESEYEWENVHAHKTWFVRKNGVNYHFYCAINKDNERYIALAVSE